MGLLTAPFSLSRQKSKAGGIKAYQCSYRTETAERAWIYLQKVVLKHINVHIELKRQIVAIVLVLVGIKAYQCSYELKYKAAW